MHRCSSSSILVTDAAKGLLELNSASRLSASQRSGRAMVLGIPRLHSALRSDAVTDDPAGSIGGVILIYMHGESKGTQEQS